MEVQARSRIADAALLNAWRKGDSVAGQRLFERHFARLFRFFWNKVDSEESAHRDPWVAEIREYLFHDRGLKGERD